MKGDCVRCRQYILFCPVFEIAEDKGKHFYPKIKVLSQPETSRLTELSESSSSRRTPRPYGQVYFRPVIEHLVNQVEIRHSHHILRIEFFVNSLKNEKYVTKRRYLEEKL